MSNIFLEKLCTKCGGETSPRPFSENLKLRANKINLLSGNADDEESLHRGGRKFIFLIDFQEIFPFHL